MRAAGAVEGGQGNERARKGGTGEVESTKKRLLGEERPIYTMWLRYKTVVRARDGTDHARWVVQWRKERIRIRQPRPRHMNSTSAGTN